MIPLRQPIGADGFVVQPASTRLLLPGIVYNGGVFTIIAAQNLAPAPADVRVAFRPQGNIVATVQQLIMAGAAVSVDLRAVAGLPEDFAGSALISSNQDVIAQVDTFSQRIVGTPPASIAITGPALVQKGQPVFLTAVVSPANADTPITYTWQATDLGPSRARVHRQQRHGHVQLGSAGNQVRRGDGHQRCRLGQRPKYS